MDSNSRHSNVSITCQSVSAAREGYPKHCAAIQIYQQDRRGVFAPSFVELNADELAGTAASSGLLGDEVAVDVWVGPLVLSVEVGLAGPPDWFVGL